MNKTYFHILLYLVFNTTYTQVSLVKNISSNAKSSSITSTNLGVIFAADDMPNIINIEPYISDGTESTTFKLKEINTNNVLTNAASLYINDNNEFVEMNNFVYFAAGTASNNVELWRTDGTTSGTTLVKEINASLASSGNPTNLTVLNGLIFFSASNGFSGSNNGTELWISDGTTAGTNLLKDIYPGTDGSFPSDFVVHDNKVYFTANNGPNGRELWVSNGTSAGTQMVKDMASGPGSSNPKYTTSYNGDLYFTANGELFKSNGVIGNGGALRPLNNNPIIDPAGFNILGNRLFFSGETASTGRELWSTNGAPLGTSLFKDINTGTGSSNPQDFEISNGLLFFKANNGSGNFELWKSDGLAASTVAISNSNLNPSKLINYNNKIYFIGSNVSGNRRLWSSDGTTIGTIELTGYPNVINEYKMAVYNNELYFSSGNFYKYLDPTLSVKTSEFNINLVLYPSPTIKSFYLETNEDIKKVDIYNLQGQSVKSFSTQQDAYDLSELKTGIYFAKITTNNTTLTQKFVKI